MKTDLYKTITDSMQRAFEQHYYVGGGGGGCCGTDECMAKKPLAEFTLQDPGPRIDIPSCQQYQLNELCGVIEALRSRIEELESREAVRAEVTT